MYSYKMFEEYRDVLKKERGDRCNQNVQKALKTISYNGVSDVLFSLSKGPMRFSQLMFETRLNPNILNRHLRALIQLNIVKKVGQRGEYTLTETGKKLLSILNELLSLFSQ